MRLMFARSRTSRSMLAAFAWMVISLLVAPPASAQTSPVEELSQRTAAAVAKSRARQVLIAPLVGCLVSEPACSEFDAALRSALQNMVSSVQFVPREDVLRQIKTVGLIGLDAYQDIVLEPVARSVGAEILVTVSLDWTKSGYQMNSRIFDPARRKDLAQLKSKARWPLSASGREPIIFTDPDTGVSLIIPGDPKRPSNTAAYPQCQQCPEPQFTEEMRAKREEGKVMALVTITDQGLPVDAHAIRSFSLAAAESTVNAIRGWRFIPAQKPSGTPYATRTIVEVNYRWQQ